MENKALLEKISSGDDEQIAEALRDFKENGDLQAAGTLLDHLRQIKDERLVTTLSNLLTDIKDSQFRALLISKLEEAEDERTRSGLLRIVWESALDYSAYLDVFLRLLQDESFLVAFEASTVIENLVHRLSLEQIDRLREAIRHFPEEKEFLVENIREAIDREIADEEM